MQVLSQALAFGLLGLKNRIQQVYLLLVLQLTQYYLVPYHSSLVNNHKEEQKDYKDNNYQSTCYQYRDQIVFWFWGLQSNPTEKIKLAIIFITDCIM